MSDSDTELDLLDVEHVVHAIGDHELKTSPLVTKDANTAVSNSFSQRGLLGTVISVHAKGLPPTTNDPRIYLNLDAPASGLVCGVQGSGKSHTVSCILESSLIGHRQIGTLPAPLGAVVFHFDEENGDRPCEAAYLSQLDGGKGRGVGEVVVLVSPSNLKARKRVYSDLKFVQVEALRIAEADLNATRMLSMMGADNLETMPLYMHSILSILRETGSEGFKYQNFKKRLQGQEFNKAQGAMLQLRIALLDSFLQGKGPDIKSFFKPGRLVIVDVSDPFVEPTTAAILFDICLGLFIEWKSNTGKLIVLDEAHKYLTNSDANRFTRSICSIIRQQRHLAARVVVSTQEPTVVPASVLDLLSWIICHRFSSPGWVKHLKSHVCAEEDIDMTEPSVYDWGHRVMTLRTGEALLYSPASLFASNNDEIATLCTGYAIIKTRSRLTSDGGGSLLATEALLGPASQSKKVPVTHSIVKATSGRFIPYNSPSTSLARTRKSPADAGIIVGPSYDSDSQIACPRTPTTSRGQSSDLNVNEVAKMPMGPSAPLNDTDEDPTESITTETLSLANSVGISYDMLVRAMNDLASIGFSQPDMVTISIQLTKYEPPVYIRNIKQYLRQAEAAGVIKLSGEGSELTATLDTQFRSQTSALTAAAPSSGSSSSSAAGPTPPSTCNSSQSNLPPVMAALLVVMEEVATKQKEPILLSVLSSALMKHKDGDFKASGYKRFGDLAQDAHERGIAILAGSTGKRTLQVK